ncbi:helix-turn-helix transcriptional regulator [Streptomyces sp. NPDC050982]|uniref:helix-turn-helix domain-containing protein n=1 Tax=Streptomyces sp. NPDC050982 TaxID=3154746 RepID=UPI0033DFFBF6
MLARRQALGRRLRDLRTAAPYTQAGLATAAGMDRAFYVGVEGGRRNISLDKLFALADALHVDIRDLFTDPANDRVIDSPAP